jgi:hypothetical protein
VQNTVPNGPNSEHKYPRVSIDDVLIIEHVIQSAPSQSIPSRPHWRAEKGGKGIIKSYLPKYIFSLPQSAPPTRPITRNSEQPPRKALTLLIVVYQCPQPLHSSPALPSGTLGRSIILPAHPKDPLVILMRPSSTAALKFPHFFWLVGNTRCGFMYEVSQPIPRY